MWVLALFRLLFIFIPTLISRKSLSRGEKRITTPGYLSNIRMYTRSVNKYILVKRVIDDGESTKQEG